MFALRKGKWKLIEGSGDGSTPPGKWDKNVTPERDPSTGKWTRLDFFNVQWDGAYQLYDLASDPQEKNNLAQQNPEIVQELSDILDRVRRSILIAR